MLTAGYLTQVGHSALALPVVALLVLLPGLLPALALRRALDAPTAAVLPIAAGVTVAGVGLAAEAAYLAGWSLTVAGVLFVAAAVIAATLTAPSRVWEGLAWRWQPWAIAVAACLVSLFQRAWTTGGDAPYHLAAVRSLLHFGRPLVTDPFYGLPNAPLDPTSGSLAPLYALLAKVTGLDVLTVWPAMAALFAVVLVLAFWSLAEEVAGHRDWPAAAATLAFVGIIVLTDFRTYAYPGFASRGLLYIAVYAMIRAVVSPSRGAAAGVAMLSYATVATHLGSGEVELLAAAAVLVFAAAGVLRRREWRRLREWAGPAALALGVACATLVLAPLLAQRLAGLAGIDVYAPGFQLVRRYTQPIPGFIFPRPEWAWGRAEWYGLTDALGTIVGIADLVVVALMLWDAVRRPSRHAWAWAAVVALPRLLEAPPVSLPLLAYRPYMLVRLGDVADFAAFVGLAWALSRVGRLRVPARGAAAVAIGIGMAFAVPGVLSVYTAAVPPRLQSAADLSRMWRDDKENTWGRDHIADVRSLVGTSYPRVAADVGTSYDLAALAPVSVVAVGEAHSPFFVERVDGQERRADMERLISTATPPVERLRIVHKWDARYVAVSDAAGQRYAAIRDSFRAQPDAFEEVLTSKLLCVFRPKR